MNRGVRNILFIMYDQLRFDYLGCAGHPILQTPNLDALAAGGVRFTNAFVTTSICAASRAGIRTLRHRTWTGWLRTACGFPAAMCNPRFAVPRE